MIRLHFDWDLSASCKSVIVIFIILALFFIIMGIRFAKLDPKKDEVPTKGLMFFCVFWVRWANNFAVSNINEKERGFFGPFVVTETAYLGFANLSSLIGLTPPMSNVAVALSMSLIAFCIFQFYALKYQGVKNRIDGLLGPVKGVSFLVFPINLISEFMTPIAMGMRLFGNIFSGVVMAALIFGACEALGAVFGSIVATVVVAGLVHTIFDIAFGIIQVIVYLMLTILLTRQNMGLE